MSSPLYVRDRSRERSKLVDRWFTIENKEGTIVSYEFYKSETELKESVKPELYTLLLNGGKVKPIELPPIGWLNQKLLLVCEEIKSLEYKKNQLATMVLKATVGGK